MFSLNMTSLNASLPLDDNFAVVVRVFFITGACVGSTVGNAVILAVFWISTWGKRDEKSRCRVVDIIIASLTVVAFLRGVILGFVRIACFASGEWLLGDSMCQLQAYVEAMLRNTIPWYLSFLSLERYIKHRVPHEYLVTFSPLTVTMILPGLLLVVIVPVTGPLYGWGKYEYIKEIALCGSATPSPFGCSYALYLLTCLTLPSFLVILINCVLLSSVICRKNTKSDTWSLTPCGNSRVLSAKNEIPTLVILMILFLILSVPRLVLDAVTVCSESAAQDLEFHQHHAVLSSSGIFTIYYLESLTDLIFPFLCLTMHPKARKVVMYALLNDLFDCREKQASSTTTLKKTETDARASEPKSDECIDNTLKSNADAPDSRNDASEPNVLESRIDALQSNESESSENASKPNASDCEIDTLQLNAHEPVSNDEGLQSDIRALESSNNTLHNNADALGANTQASKPSSKVAVNNAHVLESSFQATLHSRCIQNSDIGVHCSSIGMQRSFV